MYFRPLKQQNSPKEGTRWREAHAHTDVQMYTRVKDICPETLLAYLGIIKDRTSLNKEMRQNGLSRQTPRDKNRDKYNPMYVNLKYGRRAEGMQGRQEKKNMKGRFEKKEWVRGMWQAHIC